MFENSYQNTYIFEQLKQNLQFIYQNMEKSLRAKRIEMDLKSIKNALHSGESQQIEIVEEKELQSGVFAICGAIDSPYEGFLFRVFVEYGEEYPTKPPKVSLMEKIWNPYVDIQSGEICIDILDSLSQNDCNYNNNGWTPTFTIEKLLISIISVLAESKITYVEKGFLNPQAAIQMMNNYPYFYNHAKKICEQHHYKKKNIFENVQRGLPQEHIVKAEGQKLRKIIEKESKSQAMKKKEMKSQSEQIQLAHNSGNSLFNQLELLPIGNLQLSDLNSEVHELQFSANLQPIIINQIPNNSASDQSSESIEENHNFVNPATNSSKNLKNQKNH